MLRIVQRMKDVITMTRKNREHGKLGNAQPLNNITVLHDDESYFKDLDIVKYYIMEDGNVKNIT